MYCWLSVLPNYRHYEARHHSQIHTLTPNPEGQEVNSLVPKTHAHWQIYLPPPSDTNPYA